MEKLLASDTSHVNRLFLLTIGRKPTCSPGFGWCAITINDKTERVLPASNNPTVAAVSVYDKKKMTLFFPAGLPPSRQNMGFLPVDEDIWFSAEDAQAMGAKSLTVLKGNYKILTIAGKEAITVKLRTQ